MRPLAVLLAMLSALVSVDALEAQADGPRATAIGDCPQPFADPGDGPHLVYVEPTILEDPSLRPVAEALWAERLGWFDAAYRADPDERALYEWLTKEAGARVHESLADFRARCRGIRGSTFLYVRRVHLLTDSRAWAWECLVESNEWFDLRTGNRIGEPGRHRQSAIVEFHLVGGSWRLDDVVNQDGCPAAGAG